MTTTSTNLRTIATRWPDLADMLGTPNVSTWPPSGLRNHLNTSTREEVDETTLLRHLERNPAQIGVSVAPMSARVFDTMQAVTTSLVDLADTVAAVIQYAPATPTPARHADTWPANPKARRTLAADDARRDLLAMKQAHDPRRWRYTGQRTAPLAALWLLARVQGVRGPFRPLSDEQAARIANVAAGAAQRIERTLDIAARTEQLTPPCPTCSGTIEVHGGAGASPLARCTGCGHVWSVAGRIPVRETT